MVQQSIDFLVSSSGAAWLVNLQIKALIVLLLFLSLEHIIRGKLSSSARGLFLTMAYVSVLVQPLSWMFAGLLSDVLLVPSVMKFSFDVIGSAEPVGKTLDAFALLYLFPVMILALRLVFALSRLGSIKRTSKPASDTAFLALLNNSKHRLEIARPVQLSFHAQVNSPISFGLFAPQIVLPAQAENWSSSMAEHVLLHELMHIKRFDWLRLLLAYCITILLWINPLAWLLLSRTRAVVEEACDEEVVLVEGDGADYAQNLVGVARLCRSASLNKVGLAQSMLEHSSLKLRIHQILEAKKMPTQELQNQCNKVLMFSCVLTVVLLLGMSGSQNVVAQARQPENTSAVRNREFLPVHTVVPYYPTEAANDAIEGWVQLQFSVGTQGEVIKDSIEIIDAEPATIFNASARAALEEFRFTEYAPDGFPVIVPNVQYVFRYKMTDEN